MRERRRASSTLSQKRCASTSPSREKWSYETVSFASLSEETDENSERSLGVLVLLSVPIAWGTFEPAVRYAYEIEPPVPGFLFSVCYYFVAAVTLSSLAFFSKRNSDGCDHDKLSSSSFPARGGLELGSYLFLGNGLQVS
jgi:hypothetical protein